MWQHGPGNSVRRDLAGSLCVCVCTGVFLHVCAMPACVWVCKLICVCAGGRVQPVGVRCAVQMPGVAVSAGLSAGVGVREPVPVLWWRVTVGVSDVWLRIYARVHPCLSLCERAVHT